MVTPPLQAVAEPPFARRVIDWQRSHGRHRLPWQRTRDPYRVWLSEVMLQQTQVATVLGYYERFLARFPDVRALAAAPLDDVLALWSGLGYYSRARNLHRCAVAVVERHGGAFPASSEALAGLPGIGRSTAAAIAAFCFGERAAILDGNVRRVLARLLGFEGDLSQAGAERALWAQAEALLPAGRDGDARGGTTRAPGPVHEAGPPHAAEAAAPPRPGARPRAARDRVPSAPEGAHRGADVPGPGDGAMPAAASAAARDGSAHRAGLANPPGNGPRDASPPAGGGRPAPVRAPSAETAAPAHGGEHAGFSEGVRETASADAVARAHDDIASYTQGLMDLGSAVCTTRSPACLVCPVAGLCVARRQGAPERYPVRTRRTKRTRRESWWLWLESGGRVFLCQRPATGVWAGLWTLPLFDDAASLEAAAARLGVRAEPLATVAHALTHFDWLLHPRRAALAADAPAEALGAGRWFALDALEGVALPAPLRRLLAAGAPAPFADAATARAGAAAAAGGRAGADAGAGAVAMPTPMRMPMSMSMSLPMAGRKPAAPWPDEGRGSCRHRRGRHGARRAFCRSRPAPRRHPSMTPSLRRNAVMSASRPAPSRSSSMRWRVSSENGSSSHQRSATQASLS